jgi:hypothetical protein
MSDLSFKRGIQLMSHLSFKRGIQLMSDLSFKRGVQLRIDLSFKRGIQLMRSLIQAGGPIAENFLNVKPEEKLLCMMHLFS